MFSTVYFNDARIVFSVVECAVVGNILLIYVGGTGGNIASIKCFVAGKIGAYHCVVRAFALCSKEFGGCCALIVNGILQNEAFLPNFKYVNRSNDQIGAKRIIAGLCLQTNLSKWQQKYEKNVSQNK